jgi:ribonucleoside-triphosphate reductase
LLGVSIAGALDTPQILLDESNQQQAAKKAIQVNKVWAKKIGINQAARITLGKPDGNTSVTFGCAPGFHPHHSRRYFRRIQCNKHDPLFKFFKEHNPHMCQESVWSSNKTDEVITFPITAPETAIIKDDLTALKHLELIKKSQQNWVIPGTTEANKKNITHNISCTVLVRDNEWEDVTNYLYKNREIFTAVSLLPYTGDKIYKQAPLEAVTTPEDEALWKKLVENYRPVDYKKLYEEDDNTKLMEEAACSGGQCLI